MNINETFESLKASVSEECYNEIIDIIIKEASIDENIARGAAIVLDAVLKKQTGKTLSQHVAGNAAKALDIALKQHTGKTLSQHAVDAAGRVAKKAWNTGKKVIEKVKEPKIKEEYYSDVDNCYSNLITILTEATDPSNALDTLLKKHTGKTLDQHMSSGMSKAYNGVKSAAKRTRVGQHLFGRRALANATHKLNNAENAYRTELARRNSIPANNYAERRLNREEAKRLRKEASDAAKEVGNVRREYGF